MRLRHGHDGKNMVVFEAPEMLELPQFVAILMVFLDAQNWI